MSQAALSSFSDCSVGAAHSVMSSHYPLQEIPSERHESEGKSMRNALGNSARILHVPNDANIAERKLRNQEFLAREASKRSEKEVHNATGMSTRAVGNLRQRRNKISFDNFVDWCLNDKDFMAEFAEYVGFIKPGSAAFAAAMTKAVNAYQQIGGDE